MIFVHSFQIISTPASIHRESALHMARRLEKGKWEKIVETVESDEPYEPDKHYLEPPVPVNPGETSEWHPTREEEFMVNTEPVLSEDEVGEEDAGEDIFEMEEEEELTPEEEEARRQQEIEERKLIEAMFQKYPDLPEVCIEDIEDDFEMQPIMGEKAGCDAPLDAPWRIEAENIMRSTTEGLGLELYDVLWSLREVEVTIKARDDDKEGLTVEKLSQLAKALTASLEEREDDLQILNRHELIVATPGSPDLIATERQFQAFKGFDVVVTTAEPTSLVSEPRKIEGKLIERTADELKINVGGRTVTIPTTLVDEVRLPEALYESGDPAAPEDDLEPQEA